MFATTVGATDCTKFMHRPEGLTWGPKLLGQHQQLLYVTGYTGSAGAPPPVNDVVRAYPRQSQENRVLEIARVRR